MKNEKENKKKETDKKLENMRSCIADKEKCKIIAQKLSEYIKDSKN